MSFKNAKEGDILNVDKFKGKVVEKGFTLGTFCDAVDIPRTTLYRRLTKGGDDFTIGEVKKIVNGLNLSNTEAIEIFL